ncbi:hypothetical protein NPIL_684981 [Nephila pilipes]|uniref:Uncharacterized protein n=1 Tax=Nephila pilipes TaxID=299642 RepID=A0A8X6PC44_NEPPI|nr:hypothetical protein NPIL_684981 [Nephila pilipes]
MKDSRSTIFAILQCMRFLGVLETSVTTPKTRDESSRPSDQKTCPSVEESYGQTMDLRMDRRKIISNLKRLKFSEEFNQK